MKHRKAAAALLLAAALSACSSVKRELGVGRNSPDEFAVVKRAPLTLPPDYELRAPGEGGAPPAANASATARAALLGGTDAPAAKGGAEAALLDKLGAGKADPAIRAAISRENGYIAVQNETVAEKLIFWKDAAPNENKIPSSVVDPAAEKDRLDKNKEEGKPANTGDVPVIEKKKGTIDRIF